jgi:hypothetical protein
VTECGLLEQSAVLLRPADAAAARAITCAHTGQLLGCARQEPAGARSWWRRLAPALVAVYEQPDEPLVFTVHRGWGLRPRREVRDADGHPIGGLRGPRVENAHGRTVALLGSPEEAGARAFRAPDGTELARLTPGPEGLGLVFAANLVDPFLKMLLLAAALTGD